MKDITALLDELDTSVAVVGATDDPSKYGHVIYLDLKRKGFTVCPVNPHRPTVDGDPTYKQLGDIPEKPTIVNLVVPPEVTAVILRECLELDLDECLVAAGGGKPGEHDHSPAARF